MCHINWVEQSMEHAILNIKWYWKLNGRLTYKCLRHMVLLLISNSQLFLFHKIHQMYLLKKFMSEKGLLQTVGAILNANIWRK